MINGMHAIVFSPEAEKVRDFFADVIGLSSVDAGGGWLIFVLPPAELAVHPADGEIRLLKRGLEVLDSGRHHLPLYGR